MVIHQKMPQSGVGSMQVLAIERTHRGGMHPQCNPTNRRTYFHRGGGRTHNVTQQTDTPFFWTHTHTHKQTKQNHILRQHAA